jgi:hypothetical protein
MPRPAQPRKGGSLRFQTHHAPLILWPEGVPLRTSTAPGRGRSTPFAVPFGLTATPQALACGLLNPSPFRWARLDSLFRNHGPLSQASPVNTPWNCHLCD